MGANPRGGQAAFKSTGSFRSDVVRTGGLVLQRNQVTYLFDSSPSRLVPHVTLAGELGDEIEFEGHRPGTGGEIKAQVTLRPTDHLELLFDGDGYRLNWQTALFAGFGDERALSEKGALQSRGRQIFLKASWAFAR